MKSYKDLELWKSSILMIKEIYMATHSFPAEEKYGLVQQMRKCAVSIPSNIAEGAGRNHNKEFVQFLYIASGSLSELETQIIICKELNFINTEMYDHLIEH